MKVLHTSPNKIEKIEKHYGVFGDCLFFSDEEYVMAACDTVTYELELDEDKVIAARELHDDEIINDIADLFGVDADTAEGLLDGSESEWDYMTEPDAEMSWKLQSLRAECAVKMGFEACEDEDEQGTVYIVPMFGREADLKLVA